MSTNNQMTDSKRSNTPHGHWSAPACYDPAGLSGQAVRLWLAQCDQV